MKSVLLATNNPGKLFEVREFAAGHGVKILSPKQLGLDVEVEETGKDFEANAILKATVFMKAVEDPDLWVVGDDSGVTIDALNGEPGVHTRRWADHNKDMTDDEIIDYTLSRLKGVPYEQRTAQLVCGMALGRKNDYVVTFSSSIEGVILEEPNSKVEPREGFPFRKLFYVPEADGMLGEFENGADTLLTHRQQSFKKVIEHLAR
jgi:XTP/dITP diphosphohydrolase